ncbi:hypothetical protein SH1V18_11090 [Vallitalea longa]|uniref:Uncharacterized protein n=1 Tax=Vallitalea longa TaxID=2936439 RepID=A0A9W5YAY9_9FIRM|nr:hypothetical protein [Vallitalea longa]GKX28629.1 hypothetical protein SH1V18_11090 [Vallitalea longa]
MTIGVLGFTDKRPILYPLVKLLEATGDVIVITDDRHFKRLIEDYSSLGHLGNIMICVTDATPDEVWEEIELEADDFDHVIFDLRDTIHEDIQLYIHVKGSDFEDGEEDLLECIDEYTEFKLMYDGKTDKAKDTINIPINLKIISSIEVLENKKILLPSPSNKVNMELAKLLAPHLDIKTKDALKILKRGWQA